MTHFTTQKDVLDHGYVRLITWTPSDMVGIMDALMRNDIDAVSLIVENNDITAVNAARASYGKKKSALDDSDKKLIKFLADAEPVPHSSPFRHSHVTLEINAPIPVARQWWRHAIGAGTTEDGTPWSELSRRYVRGGIQYHVPEVWRSKPENSKQGSGAAVTEHVQHRATDRFIQSCDFAVEVYEELLEDGIAAEQARLVLPQGVYTSWQWSPSIQALNNFLVHRLAPDAQAEIRLYAQATYDLVRPLFPYSIDAFVAPTT